MTHFLINKKNASKFDDKNSNHNRLYFLSYFMTDNVHSLKIPILIIICTPSSLPRNCTSVHCTMYIIQRHSLRMYTYPYARCLRGDPLSKLPVVHLLILTMVNVRHYYKPIRINVAWQEPTNHRTRHHHQEPIRKLS